MGFLSRGAVNIVPGDSLLGGRPVHCRTLSSTLPTPAVTTKNISRHCHMSQRAKLPPSLKVDISQGFGTVCRIFIMVFFLTFITCVFSVLLSPTSPHQMHLGVLPGPLCFPHLASPPTYAAYWISVWFDATRPPCLFFVPPRLTYWFEKETSICFPLTCAFIGASCMCPDQVTNPQPRWIGMKLQPTEPLGQGTAACSAAVVSSQDESFISLSIQVLITSGQNSCRGLLWFLPAVDLKLANMPPST